MTDEEPLWDEFLEFVNYNPYLKSCDFYLTPSDIALVESDFMYIVGPADCLRECSHCHEVTNECLYNRVTKEVFCPACEEKLFKES